MRGSAIWSPHRVVGLRAFIAPWKTIEIPRQRTFSRNSSVENYITSSPDRRPWPSYSSTFLGRSRRMAFAVDVLPHPLSPTLTIVSPHYTNKQTSPTAHHQPHHLQPYYCQLQP